MANAGSNCVFVKPLRLARGVRLKWDSARWRDKHASVLSLCVPA